MIIIFIGNYAGFMGLPFAWLQSSRPGVYNDDYLLSLPEETQQALIRESIHSKEYLADYLEDFRLKE